MTELSVGGSVWFAMIAKPNTVVLWVTNIRVASCMGVHLISWNLFQSGDFCVIPLFLNSGWYSYDVG